MAKLDKTKREELINFIRQLVNKELELKNIQGKIFIEFGVYFSLRSICYYVEKADRERRLKKYQEENELMKKWWCAEPVEEIENVAELLFDAVANGNDTSDAKIRQLLE